jgi:hypothetical protein
MLVVVDEWCVQGVIADTQGSKPNGTVELQAARGVTRGSRSPAAVRCDTPTSIRRHLQVAVPPQPGGRATPAGHVRPKKPTSPALATGRRPARGLQAGCPRRRTCLHVAPPAGDHRGPRPTSLSSPQFTIARPEHHVPVAGRAAWCVHCRLKSAKQNVSCVSSRYPVCVVSPTRILALFAVEATICMGRLNFVVPTHLLSVMSEHPYRSQGASCSRRQQHWSGYNSR